MVGDFGKRLWWATLMGDIDSRQFWLVGGFRGRLSWATRVGAFGGDFSERFWW